MTFSLCSRSRDLHLRYGFGRPGGLSKPIFWDLLTAARSYLLKAPQLNQTALPEVEQVVKHLSLPRTAHAKP